MADLRAAVRDAIKHEEEISHTGDLARALDVVLELHAPHPEHPGHCRTCLHWDQSAQQYQDYPCPELLAIAEELKIEVNGR